MSSGVTISVMCFVNILLPAIVGCLENNYHHLECYRSIKLLSVVFTKTSNEMAAAHIHLIKCITELIFLVAADGWQSGKLT